MAAKPKTTFTATASDGTVVEWTTTRPTTHAVMVKVERQSDSAIKWGLVSTNGRYELALKELLKWKAYLAKNPENWASNWWDGVSGVSQQHVAYELVEVAVKA